MLEYLSLKELYSSKLLNKILSVVLTVYPQTGTRATNTSGLQIQNLSLRGVHPVYLLTRVDCTSSHGGKCRTLSTTSALIVRGTRFFQLRKTWNGKYESATKNTIAPEIKCPKTCVNGLQ